MTHSELLGSPSRAWTSPPAKTAATVRDTQAPSTRGHNVRNGLPSLRHPYRSQVLPRNLDNRKRCPARSLEPLRFRSDPGIRTPSSRFGLRCASTIAVLWREHTPSMMAGSGKIKGLMQDPRSDKVTAWLTWVAPCCARVAPLLHKGVSVDSA